VGVARYSAWLNRRDLAAISVDLPRLLRWSIASYTEGNKSDHTVAGELLVQLAVTGKLLLARCPNLENIKNGDGHRDRSIEQPQGNHDGTSSAKVVPKEQVIVAYC
jgi:hypothetical protein